jgi:hypothetical protein
LAKLNIKKALKAWGYPLTLGEEQSMKENVKALNALLETTRSPKRLLSLKESKS